MSRHGKLCHNWFLLCTRSLFAEGSKIDTLAPIHEHESSKLHVCCFGAASDRAWMHEDVTIHLDKTHAHWPVVFETFAGYCYGARQYKETCCFWRVQPVSKTSDDSKRLGLCKLFLHFWPLQLCLIRQLDHARMIKKDVCGQMLSLHLSIPCHLREVSEQNQHVTTNE